MNTKRTNPQANATRFKWESEIDKLVAPRELYGLSEDEVKIVEGRA